MRKLCLFNMGLNMSMNSLHISMNSVDIVMNSLNISSVCKLCLFNMGLDIAIYPLDISMNSIDIAMGVQAMLIQCGTRHFNEFIRPFNGLRRHFNELPRYFNEFRRHFNCVEISMISFEWTHFHFKQIRLIRRKV